MFSYFTGSSTAGTTDATTSTEAPTTRVERTSGAVCPEDAKYADLVLLPNRKLEDDFLFKVDGNSSSSRSSKKPVKGPKKASNEIHDHSDSNFDVVTATAFDMVEVQGGQVPKYIKKTNHAVAGSKGISRCASGEEWVVVSPKKATLTQ